MARSIRTVHPQQTITNRHWWLMAAIVVFAAITPSLLLTAPAVAAQLASQWGLNPAQIGNLFMVELGAMSIATLPAFWWLKRVNLSKAAFISGLIFIIGNLLSAIVADYNTLMALRLFTALGAGSLMIICMSSAARLPNASRAYGLWVLGQLTLGAIGLQVLPRLFQHYGLAACYITLAILMAVALPLTRSFPASIANTKINSTPELNKGKATMGLLAIFCFYISLSGVWTFIGSISSSASINAQDTGQILAVATVMGIIGAGGAALIGNRLSQSLLLIIGYAVMATAVLLLKGRPDLLRFTIAALAFKFTWTFILPLLLARIVELAPSGSLMNASNLVIGSGLAVGPCIAGYLIQSSGDYSSTLLGATTLILLSLILILISRSNASA
ncbi:MFS transporter [Pseudomonas canadensis]|uniref:MFS transporter n=1 Tax=Pseudomonas canadensis TaxID=915099 RepID=UPI002B243756|nr:MFS transporter [Pseudomonas canadensis]MEB2647832.1 MFS transporter [Pseudomonas canadensis]